MEKLTENETQIRLIQPLKLLIRALSKQTPNWLTFPSLIPSLLSVFTTALKKTSEFCLTLKNPGNDRFTSTVPAELFRLNEPR